MRFARTATAAAVAGLVAVAAWSASLGPGRTGHFVVGSGATAGATGAEWQLAATGEDLVPGAVLDGASHIRIAIIDTGADLSAPDIAAKHPLTHNAQSG